MLTDDRKKNIRRLAEQRAERERLPDVSIDERLLYELRVHQIELEMQNEELLRSQQELSESRRRYAALFENAPIGYFVFDQDGVIIEINHCGTDFLETDRRFAVGKPFVVFLAPASHVAFFDHLNGIFGRQTSTKTLLQLKSRSGRLIWGRAESGPHDDPGRSPRCITAITDVTEQVQMHLDLIAAKEAAETAGQVKSCFMANVSHEIRTPLNGLMGMAELLLQTDLDQTQREYVEASRESANALLHVVGDILDFGRLESGDIVVNAAPFDLRELLQDAQRMFQPAAQLKGLHFEVACDHKVPECLLGDKKFLRQVLNNLIGNAIKFTANGSVRVRVGVVTEAACAGVRIEVIDSGIGIPDEHHERIFEGFYQADGSYRRRHQGSGLGLAIARRLVQSMNGTITVDSTPGTGSTFVLTIPFRSC